jgi:hypothetical protein
MEEVMAKEKGKCKHEEKSELEGIKSYCYLQQEGCCGYEQCEDYEEAE